MKRAMETGKLELGVMCSKKKKKISLMQIRSSTDLPDRENEVVRSHGNDDKWEKGGKCLSVRHSKMV